MIKVLRIAFVALLFILGITLAMENREPVILKYYFGFQTLPIPLFLLILLSFLLGVLVAGVGFIFDQWSLRRALRNKDGEIANLRREIKIYQQREREILGIEGRK